jgi:hypothetical protein
MDSDATANYGGAVAAGRAVGGYHFVGWDGNAAGEATYFMQAMSPLAENDVYALDLEKGTNPIPANAVQYTLDMVNLIHSHINVWPLVYMNLSTLNSYDWTPVLQNCGLWLADWAVSPNQNIPTLHTYVMQQYSDGPKYDHDEWFGTVEQFKKYGYHAPIAVPSPTPPAPVVTPPTPVTPPINNPSAGQGSGEQTTNTPVLPGLTNNVPPAPITIQTPVNTNTSTVHGSTSTLDSITSNTSKVSSQGLTKSSWWARFISWLKGVFHVG